MKVYEIVDLFENKFTIEDQNGEIIYCGTLTKPEEPDFKLTYEILHSEIIKLGSYWELPVMFIYNENGG